MIKVLKHGNKHKFTKTCSSCNCEFEFNEEDLVVDTSVCLTSMPPQYKRYIICPECGEKIFHDTIFDNNIHKNIILTDSTSNLTCEGCSWYEQFKNNPVTGPYVGDTPCTWCNKRQPYCVNK